MIQYSFYLSSIHVTINMFFRWSDLWVGFLFAVRCMICCGPFASKLGLNFENTAQNFTNRMSKSVGDV